MGGPTRQKHTKVSRVLRWFRGLEQSVGKEGHVWSGISMYYTARGVGSVRIAKHRSKVRKWIERCSPISISCLIRCGTDSHPLNSPGMIAHQELVEHTFPKKAISFISVAVDFETSGTALRTFRPASTSRNRRGRNTGQRWPSSRALPQQLPWRPCLHSLALFCARLPSNKVHQRSRVSNSQPWRTTTPRPTSLVPLRRPRRCSCLCRI